MTLKVAYLSNYHENSGYSIAAQNYIISLDKIGVKVTPRRISMTGTEGKIYPRIKELEDNDLYNTDVVIQHNLPSEFSYRGDVLNVGMFAYETDWFPWTNWKEHLHNMDEIINFCQDDVDATIKTCGEQVRYRTWCVPHALDFSKFRKDHAKYDFDLPHNCYKFYTIGEWNKRKNISSLVASYLKEFTSYDNVALIIKTSTHAKKIAESTIEEIKSSLNKFKDQALYPPIILIAQNLTEDYLNSIHQSCDCYVNSSNGESFCIPAFEALGFGNAALVPNYGPFKDFNFPFTVKTHPTPVLGMNNSPPNLYTSDETWYKTDIEDMSNKMRSLYEDNRRNLIDYWDKIKSKLDFENVGNKLLRIIDAK